MCATRKSPFLGIHTTLGPEALFIRSLSVSEQIGRLFQIEVELGSDKANIDFEALVGSAASVRLTTPTGDKRHFHGLISRFTQTGQDRSHFLYRATLVPWLWMLTRTSDCRIFQEKSVPDIIEAVFKAQGFKDYQLKLNGAHQPHEYCVQYRETDFAFVSRLMEQEGIFYYFEHHDDSHVLVLADSPSAHQAFPNYATLTYKPPTQQREEAVESVLDWVLEKEVQPGVVALADFNFTTPAAPIAVNANISRSHEGSQFEIYDYPGAYDKRNVGEDYARIRIEELQAQYELVRANTTARGISAGHKFTLRNHYRADQNRDYLVTSARLQAMVGLYRSGTDQEDHFSASFTAIPFNEPFRSARLTPKPLIRGPQTAIVVGKAGEEIDTDKYGRVKVQFHWDRYGKMDENASCWVRVSQPWAGKTWGAIYTPRIGQEVIVEFLEGDPDRPIITGRVYNAANMVPYALPAQKNVSTLKSNSTKGGNGFNEIKFDDTKGSELVYVQAEKDRSVLVKNDNTESVGHDETVSVRHDRKKTVGHDETTSISDNRTESVGKNEQISIGGSRSESVSKDETISIGENRTESVGKDETITIGGKRTEEVAKDEDVTVNENRTVSIAKNDTLSVGKALLIEAGDQITIKTGDASITLKKDGTIQIKGKDITVVGSGKIGVKASGDVVIKGSKVAQN